MRRSIVGAATIWWFVSAGVVFAHRNGPPPTDPTQIALAWHLDPGVIGLLLATVVVHAALVRRVNRTHPGHPWSSVRTALFLAGMTAVGLALLSPIDALSGDLLTVHMVQHLLLTIVAPPLIAAAGIGTLILRAADPSTRRRFVLPILHSRIVAGLTHPILGAVAFAAVMWGSHFSGLYNLALLDDGVHAFEHGLYFGASLLFWWPLFSPDPSRWRMHPAARLLLVVIEMPQMSFLAMGLLNAPAPLYPAYLGRPDAFGIDALTDQRIAGSLMWLTGDLGLLTAAGVLLWRLFRHEEEQTRRIDARLDRAARTAASPPAPQTED